MSILDSWLEDNKSFVKFDFSGVDVMDVIGSSSSEEMGTKVRFPSLYYFITADGTSLFIKAKTRSAAQELLNDFCTEWCGKKGHYTLRVVRDEKSKGGLSCSGTATRSPKKN